ncbi:uncharacterized protein LOC123565485 [Mercenaria mercenaria]|uniref:uncharacterized protein LOC123565485 n=1 Tax=Mercenaria mercenaria TaxID=6596 RepID=UPI00234F2278|nr:uncharacterized protein LOC123565485 [Mercenaria mercenaria]
MDVQNRMQRGFTPGSSPLNAAYILEEFYRENADKKSESHVILLDAKSAFDVVNHKHLLRRVYHAGITDGHWELLKSLHSQSASVVKYGYQVSELFDVFQGVRQGGILSTDLYKIYINPLLDQLENTGKGGKIGTITVNNSTCADDVCLMSDTRDDTQLLINIAASFAKEERYLLQPTKTVALKLSGSKRKIKDSLSDQCFSMNDGNLANVNSAVHLGITRTTSVQETAENNTMGNIVKARRAMYSLMGAGLHGHNGLDHETSITLYRVYVLPVLTYGIELFTPSQKQIEVLERFHKKSLKQILSLPMNTADPSVYILSGLLPMEALYHLKVLNFFNNICNQKSDSTEREIFERQIMVKSNKSNSWACIIKPILSKYELSEVETYLNSPMTKNQWKSTVNVKVVQWWKKNIESRTVTYSSLKFMNPVYTPGKFHPVLRVGCSSVLEATRIPARLRLLTGNYMLQSNRHKFNQNEVSPVCRLCVSGAETVEHFLLLCPSLESVRLPGMNEIISILEETSYTHLFQTYDQQIQLLLDYSCVLPEKVWSDEFVTRLEFHIRRLIFHLHTMRYRLYSNLH